LERKKKKRRKPMTRFRLKGLVYFEEISGNFSFGKRKREKE